MKLQLPCVLSLLGLTVALSALGCSAPQSTADNTRQPTRAAVVQDDAASGERFGALSAQLCPPLVEARCRTRARCGCAAPTGTECAAEEQARCAGWVAATYNVLAPTEPRPVDAGAMAECVRTTVAALSEAESCYASTPAPACMRLMSEAPATPPAASGVARGSAAPSGAACGQTAQCAHGLACTQGHCTRVDRCTDDAACGNQMRCRAAVVGPRSCEPAACDPWHFWNTDMVDNG